jgi:hypothetical protein
LTTPDQLRLKALEYMRKANAALRAGDKERAQEYEDMAGECEMLASVMLERGLTSGKPERIIRSMSAQPARVISSDVKRGKGRSTRKHPAQEIFYKKGTHIKAVAAELGETRAWVSSWMADGDACRAIPRRHAEYLKEKYGVPLSAWHRIAD